MLDQVLLAPYYITLKIRHALYDSGIRKIHSAEIPSISVGNVTVGGTGKTPHTEMLVRLLSDAPAWKGRRIAVLSRGYKRKSRGFQQVILEKPEGARRGLTAFFGDEPVQIKKKFPGITVAVDKDRVEGCDFLRHPEKLTTSKKGRRCIDKDFKPADVVILDDAFQYRSLKPSVSIVLVNYNRPVTKDHLIPVGRLRDLPERLTKADIIIVTKCPYYMENEEKLEWAADLGISSYSIDSCKGKTKDGRDQALFFTTVRYDTLAPIFHEGDQRYAYSKQAIMFSGIADDTPLMQYLSDSYRIVRHLSFGDHHEFTSGDMSSLKKLAEEYPTAIIVTTEKDSQRVASFPYVPDILKERLFFAPIKAEFTTEKEKDRFMEVILPALG
ncbi:MAG: tetraacyldisaccharide 4'-kinase [Bacteroidetes bacterium]|uniref:Tetraacyldisaccharide 4'-kinase n=1 Tax=Candidatus Cryptobacteroides intestinigallinarum TaxID=2840767 RepID=A0A9D9HKU6_9BACT|nr:tetraacyldisaccharide 4'-kinase [Candidatus Cryptobacteroides intestinigallinarum]